MSTQLQQAISAIKAGDKATGRQLLIKVLQANHHNELAWLWLTETVTTNRERRDCLQNVLKINPNNPAALRGLAALEQSQPPAEKQPEPTAPPAQFPPEPITTEANPPASAASSSPEPAKHPVVAQPSLPRFILPLLIGLVCLGGLGLGGLLAFTRLRQSSPLAAFVPSATVVVIPLPGASPPAETNAGPQATNTPPGEAIPDPNYLAGKEAYVAMDYEEVVARMTQVLAANPELAPAHWYRGQAYIYLDDLPTALDEMNQALTLDPNYALAYADRGRIYSELGDDTRAFADWQRALALDPTLAKAHHNIGVMYYNQGDYPAALEAYNAALTIDDGRAGTWLNQGETRAKLGDTQGCIDSISRAIILEPTLWSSYSERGICYANLGHFELAVADFDIYLAQVQDNAKIWYNRGLSHRYLGHNEQAVADYTQALALDPTFAWALINRGNAYLDLGDLDLSLADYNEALKQGDIPRALLGRADVYWKQGDYQKALAEYEHTLEVFPGYADVYIRLSRVHLENGSYEAAIEAADQAVTYGLSPRDEGYVRQNRGRAYYAMGQYEAALAEQNWILETTPTQKDFYYRGLTYQALGQNEPAIADFETFLNSGGGNDPAAMADAEQRLTQLRQ
ncbi:MAG: tetratricopeptide repeat protein [Anaerolineae bacterium]|nr:tetratricopeptide repeat protein [Anaerolineae bacterium]